MSVLEKLSQIKRLDYLIRITGTGSPKNLSYRLGISERHIYNIINEMKEMGAPIRYCNAKQSYYYDKRVVFKFGFIDEDEIKESLRGGVTNRSDLLSIASDINSFVFKSF